MKPLLGELRGEPTHHVPTPRPPEVETVIRLRGARSIAGIAGADVLSENDHVKALLRARVHKVTTEELRERPVRVVVLELLDLEISP